MGEIGGTSSEAGGGQAQQQQFEAIYKGTTSSFHKVVVDADGRFLVKFTLFGGRRLPPVTARKIQDFLNKNQSLDDEKCAQIQAKITRPPKSGKTSFLAQLLTSKSQGSTSRVGGVFTRIFGRNTSAPSPLPEETTQQSLQVIEKSPPPEEQVENSESTPEQNDSDTRFNPDSRTKENLYQLLEGSKAIDLPPPTIDSTLSPVTAQHEIDASESTQGQDGDYMYPQSPGNEELYDYVEEPAEHISSPTIQKSRSYVADVSVQLTQLGLSKEMIDEPMKKVIDMYRDLSWDEQTLYEFHCDLQAFREVDLNELEQLLTKFGAIEKYNELTVTKSKAPRVGIQGALITEAPEVWKKIETLYDLEGEADLARYEAKQITMNTIEAEIEAIQNAQPTDQAERIEVLKAIRDGAYSGEPYLTRFTNAVDPEAFGYENTDDMIDTGAKNKEQVKIPTGERGRELTEFELQAMAQHKLDEKKEQQKAKEEED